ncbi:hypothetical protein Bca101_050732 [Brassica carinata]
MGRQDHQQAKFRPTYNNRNGTIYLSDSEFGKTAHMRNLEITLSENIFELLQDLYVGVFHRDYYRAKKNLTKSIVKKSQSQYSRLISKPELDGAHAGPELERTRALPNQSFTELMPVYESDNNRTTISCKPTTQSSTRRLVLQPVHRKLKSSSSPSLDPIWNQFNPYCNLSPLDVDLLQFGSITFRFATLIMLICFY